MNAGVVKKDYVLALIFIIFTVLVWGFSFISTKIILTQIPPISIAFFRQVIAVLALFPGLMLTKSLNKIRLGDLGILTLASFFGIVLYFVFENSGLQFTTASNASMIVAALPIFTMVSEVIFFGLKVNWKMIFFLVLSIVGVYLIVAVNGRLDFSSGRFFGNILVMCAILSWVVYNIFNKKLSHKYSSITITAYQSLISFFLFSPLILSEIHKWPSLKELKPAVILHLIFLGLFCSALAYFCYIFAAKRLGVTVSAAFLNLIPVVTVLCGFLILREKIFWIQLAGIVIVMFSIFKLTQVVPQPGGQNVNPEIRPD
jgi:drug/metabolite transporter (DMT)-like permease